MNRRSYDAPEMKVVTLENEDIITTSTGEFDGEWVTLGGRMPEDETVV